MGNWPMATSRMAFTIMIWFYERHGSTVQVETSYDNDTQEYVLVYLDQIERFSDGAAYKARLVTLKPS